ncbi:hypothetical protein MKW98_012020 [Papaver atlanticum]|uniref:Uncharacterized protein n=1 Tax=Papaver atlanticum TaxID=357466 RepID=A0AAD4XH63_9MAGN|nr:hypothetical protein MKW98_012020 [Papaver atlanticum]
MSSSSMKTMSSSLKLPTATRVTGRTYALGRRVDFNGINREIAKSGLVIKSSMPFQPLMIKSRSLSKCCSISGGGGGAQSETVTLETPNVVVSPFIGKQKDPVLDDGGSGFGGGNEPPPYYRGGGGGGGGGFSLGGSFSWGAFWFFLFVQFLKFFLMKNKESEERYTIVTGRRKTIRHYLDY